MNALEAMLIILQHVKVNLNTWGAEEIVIQSLSGETVMDMENYYKE